MKPDELNKCLKVLGLSRMQVQKLLGCRDLRVMSKDNDRCVRALVLKQDVREAVFALRTHFPELKFVAIRALPNDEPKPS